jgi:C-3',4' desaturase CrtD
MTRNSEIIVIGSGIGGLTSAALLAQQGYRVTVLEAQTYAGGCASTWTHKGFRFESGATVAGGFQPEGPHFVAGQMLRLDWPVQRHDPAWVVHLPDRHVALTTDNADVIAKFPHTARFWEQQRRVADLAWRMSAQGLPWPPRSAAELAQLVRVGLMNFPADLALIPFAFSTVYQWLQRLGLHHDRAFVRFLDGQLLISAQTTTRSVNALYGATALDLARQGVYHVEGGIGGLANTLIEKINTLGGRVLYRQRVTRIAMENGRAVGVYARRGRRAVEETFFPADFVIGNLTPWDMTDLLGDHSPAALRRETAVRKYGWGAFVLHLGVNAAAIPAGFPDHHQVLLDVEGPLGETRGIFLSLSPEWDTTRAPAGQRAMTVTTHTDVQQWWDLLAHDEQAYYARKDEYTAKIIAGLETILPGLGAHLTLTLPGTPVTYQFYTDRHMGQVGGFPQTSLFQARSPRIGVDNVRLVGDSIFPGQSTAGVTLGAIRVFRDVSRVLPLEQSNPLKAATPLSESSAPETTEHVA